MTRGQEFLPYGRQCLGDDDIAAVTDVLRGDWLTTGPMVEAFEGAAAAATGARHAVCSSSGTAGLHLAAMAVDLRPGTFAIVPSVTFLATANAVRLAGAEVLFADVDPETGLLTADALTSALEVASRDGLEVSAVLPVHLTGQFCDMKSIADRLRDHDVAVIEDAAHALGATYAFEGGETGHVGDCRFSNLAVFSTHPVKSITTGEGGFVTSSDARLAARLSMLRNNGMVRTAAHMENADLAFDSDGALNPWYYEMQELAPNYRLTDIQCALGVSQFAKLRDHVLRRRELARRYDALLPDLAPAVRPLTSSLQCQSACHIYVVLVDFEDLGTERATVMTALRARGVGTQVHYVPVHLQPYYRARYGANKLPGAEAYYRRALTLPLYVGMNEDDVERVVDALRAVLGLDPRA